MSARVLIIIPAYNEAETLASVIEHLRRDAPECDILVVDDGSNDDTAKIARAMANVAVVQLPFNLGIGGAMQTGFKFALRQGYDIAVQCDADGQHPTDQVRTLVERLDRGDLDLVVGSRYVADTGYTPSLGRRLGKSLLSRLVNAVAGGGITDTTSGFRAANRKVLRLFARHYPEDYPEPEALVIMYKAGLRAAEIPVIMRERQGGVTSIRPQNALYYMVKVALAIFVDAFRKFTHAPEEP
ncbi:MAG TPA: glycosyltransferase family 2 protein [Candidatus Hydrogenedentes bacterium]|nr:glycosyltransferase family 2 protein [Candidatus Hydrogenedentota bacterium]HPG69518.1 glycosyltransferase family 2 protein [Candidatus Hydrogenedentota bacterium]